MKFKKVIYKKGCLEKLTHFTANTFYNVRLTQLFFLGTFRLVDFSKSVSSCVDTPVLISFTACF